MQNCIKGARRFIPPGLFFTDLGRFLTKLAEICTKGIFLPILKGLGVRFSKFPFFDPIFWQKYLKIGPKWEKLIFGPILTKFAPKVYFCPSRKVLWSDFQNSHFLPLFLTKLPENRAKIGKTHFWSDFDQILAKGVFLPI